MSRDKEGNNMQASLKKLDLSKYTGLNNEKKAILKEHMGSASTKVDMNKVKDWWKYESN